MALRGSPLVGCIQFGTEFSLPKRARFITYDDMTVAQAIVAYPYDWITRLSPSELDYLVERQRLVFERARVCCATTRWAADSLVRDYGIPESRVRVVGIGATNLAREAPSRDWSIPRYLFVGKDWTRKNGEAVLRAFSAIRAEFPGATLDVVGGHPVIDQPGVRGHGLLDPGDPGTREIITTLQKTATCFVMPSLHEPSAISYVEAASAGIGAIGTISGGSSTLIGDGGLVVDPHDDEGIAAAMRTFAEPRHAEEFGGRAEARAALFTWPAVAQRLLDALLDRPALADRDAL